MLRSLKSRLTLLYVVILGVILVAFAASIYFTGRRELYGDFEDSVRRQAHAFTRMCFEDFDRLRGDEGKLNSYLKELGAAAAVFDASGARLYESPDGAPGFEKTRAAGEGAFHFRVRSRDYRFVVDTARDRSGSEYRIVFGLEEERVGRRLERMLLFFAVFIPAMLLIAWYVGRVFVRGALSPVDTLRKQAESIQRSNLSQRVPIPKTRGEIRDLAITLNDMLGRLERAFDQVNAFTSNASHELKTPLANLRTEIELALEREADVAAYQRLLASAAEEVSRMTHIVENLLLLAQLDSKQAVLRRDPVDLGDVARQAATDMEILGETRGVKVRAPLLAPGVSVSGDEVALRRVLMNLLENGVKYGREGGEVKVSVWKEGASARVEVADTGVGIPAESVPHLFDRFYRVDRGRSRSPADAIGGHGLGLSITRSLVEAHGGTITVTSREGVGTTFHVTLPAMG
ncbi:MAG TPA: ATP-binding protein [Planctomycetota bacterium]|nr:ATP-binding protein [Planctomycetota bacterium]